MENLDFSNAYDIANGSKGIIRLYVSNLHTYEYYECKVIKNYYMGEHFIHNFKLKVINVLKGNNKNVGDIISRNGKQLYNNYHETKKANWFCRDTKHKQKMSLVGGI